MRYIFILSLFFLAATTQAQQLKVPTLSPYTEIKQEVGLTEISLSYARPSAKGRKVFGQLVPFGEMWRTGANASTKLTVSEAVKIAGKECLSIRVTYEEAVGEDIWHFYFDKNSYALIGYRFYHEEEKNDGEYITLDGETMVQGIKIPQNRHWYYNKDDKFLGADFLIKGVGLRK